MAIELIELWIHESGTGVEQVYYGTDKQVAIEIVVYILENDGRVYPSEVPYDDIHSLNPKTLFNAGIICRKELIDG